MKNLIYILLIFFALPLTSLAQKDSIASDLVPLSEVEGQQPSYKNQIDLDVQFLGIEATYKTKIADKMFLGFGLGGGFLVKTNFVNNGSAEIIKIKIFTTYKISDKIEIQEGMSFSPFSFIENGNDIDIGLTTGIIMGIYYKIWKIDIGIEPSIIFLNTQRGFFASSLFIIKIPLKRW